MKKREIKKEIIKNIFPKENIENFYGSRTIPESKYDFLMSYLAS